MKYISLYDTLKKAIEDNTYPPNTHIPHTRDLISQNQVSLTTVNKAVKLLEKEGLVRRVKGKGTFVLQQGLEQSLAYKKAEKVGLLLRGFVMDALGSLNVMNASKGVDEICRKNHKSIVVLGTEKLGADHVGNEIKSSGAAGIITYGPLEREISRMLRQLKLPVVCCDNIDFDLPFDQVSGDFIRAGAMSLKKLYHLGHRKILFFGTYKKSTLQNDRDHEYWKASSEIEARFLRLKHFHSYFISFEGGETRMRARMLDILNKHPEHTGFICGGLGYFELLKSILENEPGMNKKKTDAVLITSTNKVREINGKTIFQCRWNTREMGRRAGEIMLSRLKGDPYRPAIHYVPVEMV